MGRKSSLNLLDEIIKSKNQSLFRVIFALGIRYVGERTARILASHYKNMKKLTESEPDELLAIKDIGPKVSESIVFFFKQPENIKLIQKLEAAGLNFSSLESSTREDTYLGGKLFVLTGTLSSMTREQAKEKIENLGGIVTSSLSRKTFFLVAGSAPGSKLQKAQKLGTVTLSEREFLDLIKEK
jgi:DNA ligase (NAD+)